MNLPDCLNFFFSHMNPYEKIMVSIGKIREEHQANNALGFVSDQINISKKADYFDINHCLIMGNGQTMTMTYTLEISDKEFIPTRISMELETYEEAIIEQNRW